MASRLLLLLLLPAAWAASAQPTDTALLEAILCELKQLRAATYQGQVVAPLIEANARERDQTQQRLTALEEQHGKLDQAVQITLSDQSRLREQLRKLPRSDNADANGPPVEELKKQLELEVERMTQAVQQHQSEQSRIASDAARVRSRLAELADQFDQMQRQMRSLAAASSSFCEVEATGPRP
jgi:hypothetical protein